jgi:hypothetical protein
MANVLATDVAARRLVENLGVHALVVRLFGAGVSAGAGT